MRLGPEIQQVTATDVYDGTNLSRSVVVAEVPLPEGFVFPLREVSTPLRQFLTNVRVMVSVLLRESNANNGEKGGTQKSRRPVWESSASIVYVCKGHGVHRGEYRSMEFQQLTTTPSLGAA